MVRIDAKGIHYKKLNDMIWEAIENGETEIVLDNVCGQRYIGAGIRKKVRIEINGVPGNDLGVFMDGPEITVNGNAQDGVGNTMNSGKIVVHGHAGDIIGYAMRGGHIYIKKSAGYRVGIHMKAYKENYPVIVIGGFARDFLGEYMAGGLLIVLGLEKDEDGNIAGNYVGTGMHGGEIFLRGNIEEHKLGKEVKIFQPSEEDMNRIRPYIEEFCRLFEYDPEEILSEEFILLKPYTHRPYGRLYAY
ncbi:MAG: hypothetical protein PWQ26_483 [Thermotoga sp.]|jgi:glutamate synthase domain-containing protein 3|nr:hypothetical protein [Thermotoga sp.]